MELVASACIGLGSCLFGFFALENLASDDGVCGILWFIAGYLIVPRLLNHCGTIWQ